MIKISNVSKTYSKSNIKAVNNVSFEVQEGEVFGFLGPNGAGKSTTIKMLTGILEIDEGDITFDGISVKQNAVEVKRQIGYVPDNHTVYERLTGIEYLNFICDIFNVSKADREERIEKYLQLFNLKEAANNPVKSYSHGMKQKISVIAALVHEPKYFILDEPLTGLDPESVFNLKQVMKQHCQKGNVVLFSSHVLDVVEKLCDRVAIIVKGEIKVCDLVQNLAKNGDSLEKYFLEVTKK